MFALTVLFALLTSTAEAEEPSRNFGQVRECVYQEMIVAASAHAGLTSMNPTDGVKNSYGLEGYAHILAEQKKAKSHYRTVGRDLAIAFGDLLPISAEIGSVFAESYPNAHTLHYGPAGAHSNVQRQLLFWQWTFREEPFKNTFSEPTNQQQRLLAARYLAPDGGCKLTWTIREHDRK